ncbi:MAG: hypothetical protein WBZ36_11595 [Candidatus Nitrosopolaris sp.]
MPPSAEVVSKYIENFPFSQLREKQSFVLQEIDTAFAAGYKHIILEAPTGFGKSPVAVACALTLGSSYICTSTKNLQTQYTRDFPFIRTAKLPREDASRIITDRLNKCDKIKSLDFSVNNRIKANLSAAGRVGYLPISFSHLKTQNRELADLISYEMKKE